MKPRDVAVIAVLLALGIAAAWPRIRDSQAGLLLTGRCAEGSRFGGARLECERRDLKPWLDEWSAGDRPAAPPAQQEKAP